MELARQTISPTLLPFSIHRSPLSFPSNLRPQFHFHTLSVTSPIKQLQCSQTGTQFIQQEQEEDDDDFETSTFLSLSSKPDRNMAMLDDYEMEELGYSHDPNHRSGQFIHIIDKIIIA
ncbi:hypothetical protein HanOQP8_Chr14g0530611 [Helianthus annuus]|nr:hypothetical protein HanOQP8_Chr14g0530611 [Helianthus annuus]